VLASAHGPIPAAPPGTTWYRLVQVGQVTLMPNASPRSDPDLARDRDGGSVT